MKHLESSLFLHRFSLIAFYGNWWFWRVKAQYCCEERFDCIFPVAIARFVTSAFQWQNANKTWPLAIYIGLTLGQQRMYPKAALSFPLSISIVIDLLQGKPSFQSELSPRSATSLWSSKVRLKIRNSTLNYIWKCRAIDCVSVWAVKAAALLFRGNVWFILGSESVLTMT